METAYLLLDVGGTEIKGSIATSEGVIHMPLMRFPAKAKERKEDILNNFAQIVQILVTCAGDVCIGGIGMAFPGPFDYERGISLMRGLDKYDSIYGIPLEKEMKDRVKVLRGAAFVFLHDIEAFALGASQFGTVKNAKRILCLCMGTGAGSAFVCDKKVLKQGTGIPMNGWIYKEAFQDSVIDDYLSIRGLARLSCERMGREYSGLQLYEFCQKGDQSAKDVYRIFGEWIVEALTPFIDIFFPDALLLGGQISRSFPFFGQKLIETCKKKNILIYLEKNTSIRAMQGLYTRIKMGQ